MPREKVATRAGWLVNFASTSGVSRLGRSMSRYRKGSRLRNRIRIIRRSRPPYNESRDLDTIDRAALRSHVHLLNWLDKPKESERDGDYATPRRAAAPPPLNSRSIKRVPWYGRGAAALCNSLISFLDADGKGK